MKRMGLFQRSVLKLAPNPLKGAKDKHDWGFKHPLGGWGRSLFDNTA
jgi:hypothetical protein